MKQRRKAVAALHCRKSKSIVKTQKAKVKTDPFTTGHGLSLREAFWSVVAAATAFPALARLRYETKAEGGSCAALPEKQVKSQNAKGKSQNRPV
jgi:hypothetical protein